MNQNEITTTPRIIYRTKPLLPSYAEDEIRKLFPKCKTIYILKYFTEGMSGSWVILVRPILATGNAQLPTVVKIDWAWRIERERQAYSKHIKNRLPHSADIHDQPKKLEKGMYGGLIYSLVGGGHFAIESLHQFFVDTEIDKIEKLLKERLFANLNALWRSTQKVQYVMHMQMQYDAMLPVNFVLEWVSNEPQQQPTVVNPDTLDPNELNIGDFVQVSGFQVVNINYETNRLSLDIPMEDEQACRFHLKSIPDIGRYEIGMIIDEPMLGKLVDTRNNQLKKLAQTIVKSSADLEANRINLPHSDGHHLPNPLIRLPKVLSQMCDVYCAYIHGDLHLNNVVVEGQNFFVIDFAHSREDHLLRDLIHMESAVITHLLPHYLTQTDQDYSSLANFYLQLHQAQQYFRAKSPLGLEKPFAILKIIRETARPYLFKPDHWQEYYNGLFVYLLGSIRYSSLNQFAKQLAFWGSAVLMEIIENPPAAGEPLIVENHGQGELMENKEDKNSSGTSYTIGNVGDNSSIAQGDGATAVGAGGINISGPIEGNVTINQGGPPSTQQSSIDNAPKSDVMNETRGFKMSNGDLRKNFVSYFSLSELRTIAFDLGVDYEEFGVSGKSEFALALINHLDGRSRLAELWHIGKEQRPNAQWW